jgi:hypothetical protein
MVAGQRLLPVVFVCVQYLKECGVIKPSPSQKHSTAQVLQHAGSTAAKDVGKIVSISDFVLTVRL